jgi:hypothetical protein
MSCGVWRPEGSLDVLWVKFDLPEDQKAHLTYYEVKINLPENQKAFLRDYEVKFNLPDDEGSLDVLWGQF